MPDYQYIDPFITVSSFIVLYICMIVIAYVILEGLKRMQYSSPMLLAEYESGLKPLAIAA